ncbi:MAG: VPLPA-CTERM sorting domain-containing protein [Pseudomonadota bacterium]
MRVLALAAILLSAAQAQAASLTFSETEFGSGSYTSEKIGGFSSGTQVTSQTASGNPGNALSVTTIDSGHIYFAHFLDGAVITPAHGQLFNLSYSIDYRMVTGGGAGMAFGLVLEQAGEYFLDSSFPVTGSATSVWTTFSLAGLEDADFVDMDQLATSTQFGDPVDSVDFTLPSDIRIGFYTANSLSPNRTAFFDNVTITANVAAAPVPLPAGLPLLLGALGAVVAVRRRSAGPA